MTRFSKARPNPHSFSLVPASVWNPKKPWPALALSRMLSSIAREDKTYLTTTGREFSIPRGSAWLSLETIRQDLSSAIGRIVPRHQIKYGVRKLIESGLVSKTLMEPSTKGRYGLLFTFDSTMTDKVDTIDPVTEYRIHAYGDTSNFRHGAIAHSSPEIAWQQKQPGDVMALLKHVAANGNPDSLFRTVGMWRARKDVRSALEPVFLPWIVLDIDVKGDMVQAHDITLKILSDLEDAAFDLDRCFASFSGSKGFHIAISTDQVGSPIFRDADNARECMVRFVKTITDHNFDPATLSPMQMLRLTGSCHSETGLYKRTWTANRFRSFKLHQILDSAKTFEPWQYPDPTVGEIEQEVSERFETVAKEQAQHAWELIQRMNEKHSSGRALWHAPSKSLSTILKGVSHGQAWGPKEGRDWAAFTLACYCFAHPEQHLAVRRALFLTENDMTMDYGGVRETMLKWNELNSPPLIQKVVSAKVGSAERYLLRRKKI